MRRRSGCSPGSRCSRTSSRASWSSLREVAVPRTYERGEVVFREGDGGDTCYVIRTGAVVLTRGHEDGREVALAELRAGGMFGELAHVRRRDALGHRRGGRGHRGGGPAGPRRASAWCARTRTSPWQMLAALADRVRAHQRAAAAAVLPDRRRPRGRARVLAQVESPARPRARRSSDVLVRATQAEIARWPAPRARARAASSPRSSARAWSRSGGARSPCMSPRRLRNYIH